MALAVVDLVRDDLRELAPPEAKQDSVTSSGASPKPMKAKKAEAKK
jgi:hypothetical protein